QFRVSLDGILAAPLAVSYTVTGTANNGIDYQTISGTVTIPAGTNPSAVIDVSVIDDLVFDPDETVVVTLNNPGEPNISLGTATATVTIADDEIGAGDLSIVASDPDAAEPNDTGQFTVSLNGTLAAPLTVSYVVTGTATPDGDYTALTGTVTIPAGSNPFAVIDVSVLDDIIFEPDETVTVTLVDPNEPTISLVTPSATVTIADNERPTANLSVTVNGTEDGPVAIEATVTLSLVNQTGAPITFDLADLGTGSAISGADYAALSPTAQIVVPDGSAVGTLLIPVLDDNLIEELETVDLEISNPSNPAVILGTDTAQATITDNDFGVLSISLRGPGAEPVGSLSVEDDVDFFIDLDGGTLAAPLEVNYTIGGTAENGVDYINGQLFGGFGIGQPLSGTVTFQAGASRVGIAALPVSDPFDEGIETVTITLIDPAAPNVTVNPGAAEATGEITDEPSLVSLTANDPTASETTGSDPADPGQFTVRIAGLVSDPIILTYTVTGTATNGIDYQTITNSVVLGPGLSPTTTIDISVIDDFTIEPSETVTITLVDSDNPRLNVAGITATVTIADNDSPPPAPITSSLQADSVAAASNDPMPNNGPDLPIIDGAETVGGDGRDRLTGTVDNDRLSGEGGRDVLRGKAGDDVLDGGDGRDRLKGGAGDDVLDGGADNDVLFGGRGADLFVFGAGDGNDVIRDFDTAADKISIQDFVFADLTFTATADGVLISYGDDSILLPTLDQVSDLLEDHFVF
ncbi:MAG: Calx-beta domain-containing protein, partial [Pseudomonadota bacterium]